MKWHHKRLQAVGAKARLSLNTDMGANNDVNITKATFEDAEAILKVQKLAFRREAELYNDFTLPSLLETLDHLKSEFETKTILKATSDGELVGSVRAWEQHGTCRIERLAVHPRFQGRGIGTNLLQEMENLFSHVMRFELFTGYKSERNIRLYQRLGYQAFKQQKVNEKLTFVFMEKRT